MCTHSVDFSKTKRHDGSSTKPRRGCSLQVLFELMKVDADDFRAPGLRAAVATTADIFSEIDDVPSANTHNGGSFYEGGMWSVSVYFDCDTAEAVLGYRICRRREGVPDRVIPGQCWRLPALSAELEGGLLE